MEIEIHNKSIYVLQAKSQLNSFDRKIISSLYQPIMGYEALALYFSLWSELETKLSYTNDAYFSRLIKIMNMDLNRIKTNLRILEALSLIKTFYKEDDNYNSFIIMINSPLSAHRFFNNPMLNSKLYDALGDFEYQKTKHMFNDIPLSTDKYLDVSASFRDVFNCENTFKLDNTNNIYKQYSYANITNKDVDFDLLKQQLRLYNLHFLLSNDDFKNAIEVLFLTYKITTSEVVEAIVELSNKDELNDEKLNAYFKNLNEAKKFKLGLKMIYLDDCKANNKYQRYSIINFIKEFYNNSTNLNQEKLYTLEELIRETNLEYGAINLLIEYTFKKTNELQLKYLSKVAKAFSSKNILTYERAFQELKRIDEKLNDNNKQVESSSSKWYSDSEKLDETQVEELRRLYKR